jgi:cytochrome bd-type quinol oxidase subunit 2
VTAVILWGAFPVAYAGLLSAFYLPLAGLILRGVAFEYRSKTEQMRWLWDLSFAGGSFAAAFIQSLTVGALFEGLPWPNGQHGGGDFGWFTPYAALCGVGLVSVIHSLAPLGWSRNVKATSERQLSAHTLSIGRAAYFSDCCLYLFADRTARGDGHVGRASVFVCVPHDWRNGGSFACIQCSIPLGMRCPLSWSR